MVRLFDRSVYGGMHATFLITGITSETVTELVAHKEAHIARLTTSNTRTLCSLGSIARPLCFTRLYPYKDTHVFVDHVLVSGAGQVRL